MSNTALDSISHHPSLSLYHLAVPLLHVVVVRFLPSTFLCTSVPFPSLFGSRSLSFLHPSIQPTSQSSIYPSAVTKKLGLLSKTVCVCVYVSWHVFMGLWELYFKHVHLPWHCYTSFQQSPFPCVFLCVIPSSRVSSVTSSVISERQPSNIVSRAVSECTVMARSSGMSVQHVTSVSV